MIDSQGYRANIGMIICSKEGRLLFARRIGADDAWQFPQGGMKGKETCEEALYRELLEETGLKPEHVKILGRTKDWLKYKLPKGYVRADCYPLCIGQKQIWFLLRFLGEDQDVQLNLAKKPEFNEWRWVDYWLPAEQVIFFKQKVYRQALKELEPLLENNH